MLVLYARGLQWGWSNAMDCTAHHGSVSVDHRALKQASVQTVCLHDDGNGSRATQNGDRPLRERLVRVRITSYCDHQPTKTAASAHPACTRKHRCRLFLRKQHKLRVTMSPRAVKTHSPQILHSTALQQWRGPLNSSVPVPSGSGPLPRRLCALHVTCLPVQQPAPTGTDGGQAGDGLGHIHR